MYLVFSVDIRTTLPALYRLTVDGIRAFTQGVSRHMQSLSITLPSSEDADSPREFMQALIDLFSSKTFPVLKV